MYCGIFHACANVHSPPCKSWQESRERFLSKLLADMLNTIALLSDCPKQYGIHNQDVCIKIITDNQQ